MINKAFLILVVFGFLVSGCATTENYEKILATWVGFHSDDLVSSWGPPQGFYKLSSGGSVLEYSRQRNMQLGGITTTTPQTTYHSGSTSYGNLYSGSSTTYVQTTSPTYNINAWCKTRFTTDSSGVIFNWTWEGNDCASK